MLTDLTSIALISAIILNFILGGLIMFFAQGKKSNIFFGLFAISLGIWSITILAFRTFQNQDFLLFWMKFAYIIAIYIGVFFFFFCRIFPDEKQINKKNYFLHILVTLLFSLLIGSTNFLVKSLKIESWGVSVEVDVFGWLIYATFFLSYFLSAHFFLFKKYFKTDGIIKTQILFTFLGVFLGGEIFGVLFNLILPSPFFNEWRYIWVGPFLTAIIVVPTITYAIARYQLLDIKLIATQILVAITVILSFVDVFLYRSPSEFVLRLFIFIAITIFGFFLIKSITNEVHRGEEIQKLNSELQITVTRLAEVSEKLRLQNEELKKLDQLKTEFISVASHQLRTPLTAMRWGLEFLSSGKKGKLTKGEKETIDDLTQTNNRLIKLVNELLNISRIDEGRLRVDPKPTDLVALIQSCFNDFNPLIEQKKLKLIEHYDKLPKINLDETVISKAFINLFSNAIKYSRDKKTLTVQLKVEKPNVILSIQDEGIGIPIKDQENLFKKFYRAANAVTHQTEGNGLGLYIAKSAIEISGGKIWFESQENIGTTFYISLPLTGSKPVKGEKSLS